MKKEETEKRSFYFYVPFFLKQMRTSKNDQLMAEKSQSSQ